MGQKPSSPVGGHTHDADIDAQVRRLYGSRRTSANDNQAQPSGLMRYETNTEVISTDDSSVYSEAHDDLERFHEVHVDEKASPLPPTRHVDRSERESTVSVQVDELLLSEYDVQQATEVNLNPYLNYEAEQHEPQDKASRAAASLTPSFSEPPTPESAIQNHGGSGHRSKRSRRSRKKKHKKKKNRKNKGHEQHAGEGEAAGHSTRPVSISANITYAVAIFDYAGEGADTLPVGTGERVVVLRKDSSGWWYCETAGRTGFIPRNFLIEATISADKLKRPKSFTAPDSGNYRDELNELEAHLEEKEEYWTPDASFRTDPSLTAKADALRRALQAAQRVKEAQLNLAQLRTEFQTRVELVNKARSAARRLRLSLSQHSADLCLCKWCSRARGGRRRSFVATMEAMQLKEKKEAMLRALAAARRIKAAAASHTDDSCQCQWCDPVAQRQARGKRNSFIETIHILNAKEQGQGIHQRQLEQCGCELCEHGPVLRRALAAGRRLARTSTVQETLLFIRQKAFDAEVASEELAQEEAVKAGAVRRAIEAARYLKMRQQTRAVSRARAAGRRRSLAQETLQSLRREQEAKETAVRRALQAAQYLRQRSQVKLVSRARAAGKRIRGAQVQLQEMREEMKMKTAIVHRALTAGRRLRLQRQVRALVRARASAQRIRFAQSVVAALREDREQKREVLRRALAAAQQMKQRKELTREICFTLRVDQFRRRFLLQRALRAGRELAARRQEERVAKLSTQPSRTFAEWMGIGGSTENSDLAESKTARDHAHRLSNAQQTLERLQLERKRKLNAIRRARAAGRRLSLKKEEQKAKPRAPRARATDKNGFFVPLGDSASSGDDAAQRRRHARRQRNVQRKSKPSLTRAKSSALDDPNRHDRLHRSRHALQKARERRQRRLEAAAKVGESSQEQDVGRSSEALHSQIQQLESQVSAMQETIGRQTNEIHNLRQENASLQQALNEERVQRRHMQEAHVDEREAVSGRSARLDHDIAAAINLLVRQRQQRGDHLNRVIPTRDDEEPGSMHSDSEHDGIYAPQHFQRTFPATGEPEGMTRQPAQPSSVLGPVLDGLPESVRHMSLQQIASLYTHLDGAVAAAPRAVPPAYVPADSNLDAVVPVARQPRADCRVQ